MSNFRIATAIAAIGLAAACLPPALAGAEQSEQATGSAQVVADPFFLLIQDRQVRQALSLTESQQAAIDEILRENNRQLLRVRDIGPQSAPPEIAPAIGSAKEAILAKLDAKQQSRLKQIALQAQGYDVLFDADFQQTLNLSQAQLEQLRKVGEDFREQVRAATQASSTGAGGDTKPSLDDAKKFRHEGVVAVLTPRQQQIWSERTGEPIDFSKVRPSPGWAPEFEAVDAWLQSKPLTMQELRGRVVVVHFFAFGCGNCVNNYPWYREWQNELPPDKVTIIGIHTPETSTEHDVKQLAAKLQENDLKFPVAVDNGKRNWQNWSNGVWPSVYLVDKQGRVRFWWYGELDWQGAGGQRKMKQQIRQLMAEE